MSRRSSSVGGYVIGTLSWRTGAELLGRRLIFLFTLVAYSLLHVDQALAKDPNMLSARTPLVASSPSRCT